MIKRAFSLFGILIIFAAASFGKEGMWIPTLLNKYNIEEMSKLGFKLSADDIYDINNVSMKDAVVLFGTGCTGELISNDGLLLTNHHCGFDQIQNHSTLENDYLTNGFWAKNRSEELPNPKLSVKFLNRMEDVTERVLNGSYGNIPDSANAIIARNIKKITTESSEKGKYEASVLPLFYGNQYFLHVYEVFHDVRLVGAPQMSIGKFGGDTDNWMWPRHTGDFSLFRIYAGKDNAPAKYSPDNVPYKPKKFFKISLKGVNPDDFTMVFGFPGRTQQYLPSFAITQIIEQANPDKINIRDIKLRILSADMEMDPKVRIQYASKYASTSNAWKKWQGELKGLNRLKAITVKQSFEKEFNEWAKLNAERNTKYGNIIQEFEKLYTQIGSFSKSADYYSEIVTRGTDILSLINFLDPIVSNYTRLKKEDREKADLIIAAKIEEHFNEYNFETDKKVFLALLKLYSKDLDKKFLPDDLFEIMSKKNSESVLEKLYSNSIFVNEENISGLLAEMNEKSIKKLQSDKVYSLFKSLTNRYEKNTEPYFNAIQKQIESALNIWLSGIIEMKSDKQLWPDANKTLRVSYGKVEGYFPMDGVEYDHFTTIEGIMQKDNPEIYDYNIPQVLRELYKNKDYGRYAHNGQLNVCFTASNHTTGGNSGSPVLNGDGNLIGINFDRCWEGTMSDLMFDPDRCRNIALDIRYILFVIDKVAGAKHLLDEIVIVD